METQTLKTLVLLITLMLPALAEEDAAMEPGNSPWERFQNYRAQLEDQGFTFNLVYTAEFFRNTHGGISTHRARKYRGDVSLFLEYDTEKAGLWEGGGFFAHLQEEHGKSLTNKYVGDFQVLSNIDADDFKQVSEFWFKQNFLDGMFWTKLGKQDANADFAFTDYGGEFLHSSPGFSPTIPLVTYPDPDLGVVVGFAPTDFFSVNAGVYQGDPDGGRSISGARSHLKGPMYMLEPAVHYDLTGMPGHLRLGGWLNEVRSDKLDKYRAEPGSVGQRYGWYLTWDQHFFRENPAQDDDEQGIGLFGQYGWSPEDRSEAEHYVGGGLQWIGAIPARDEDILGLGVFSVHFSDEAGFREEEETAIELFYKIRVCDMLSIKPGLQYIVNPGGTVNDDAFAMGVRMELSF